jgi:deoxyribonuclease-1
MKRIILVLTILSTTVMANLPQDLGDDEEDVAVIEPESLSARSSSEPSFSRSKRILATKIYRLHQKTFYGNCDYEIKGNRLVPIHDSCGFHYRKNLKRASRIEWEHIVPAWYFGHNLECWKEGGRKHCRDTNPKFKEMEADMHNLVPAIGEINGDRSNYPYGNIRGEKREYGRVDMEIDSSKRLAEPKRNILGDIARVYLYMRDRYGMEISPEDEARFIKWNNSDPVSRWEKKKNLLVKKYQGNENKYISDYKRLSKLEPIPTDRSNSTNPSSTPIDKSSPSSSGSEESFSDVKSDLESKLKPILDLLPKSVATILLFIIALVVFFMKKRGK